MLLKYASTSQVLAFSPLLYRYPADWVPVGLPTHDGSLEQIVEMQPELLITGEYNALTLRKRLEQMGYRIAVMKLPQTLRDIDDYQREFLGLIDISADSKSTNSFQNMPLKNKTLLLLGANGIGTGVDTLEHDLLIKAGWTNYLSLSGYVPVGLEQLVDNPPDKVYWAAPKSHSLANLMAKHPVTRRYLVNHIPEQDENWRWQCPGPWSYELIEELAQW